MEKLKLFSSEKALDVISNFARIRYKQEKRIRKAVGTLPNRLSWHPPQAETSSPVGTVEMRGFNGCNYAGKVKTTEVFVLMIAAKAKTAKCASTKKPREYNEQSAAYDMRVFLLLYFSEHNRRNTTESNW